MQPWKPGEVSACVGVAASIDSEVAHDDGREFINFPVSLLYGTMIFSHSGASTSGIKF